MVYLIVAEVHRASCISWPLLLPPPRAGNITSVVWIGAGGEEKEIRKCKSSVITRGNNISLGVAFFKVGGSSSTQSAAKS